MENWDKVIEHVNTALTNAPALVDLTTYQLSNTSLPQYSTNNIISRDFPEVIFINGGVTGRIKTEATLIKVSESRSDGGLLSLYEPSDARKGIFLVK